MKFVSTRGESPKLSFLEAVAEGLAPDGGLFVPEKMPDISGLLESWEKLSYPELRLFADDIPADDLRKIAARSYEKFDDPAIAPLKSWTTVFGCSSSTTGRRWRSRISPSSSWAICTSICSKSRGAK